MDNGHPEKAFFQKFESFGLGQKNWAEIWGGILGISSQTIGNSWLLYDVQPAFFSKKLTLIFGRYTGIQVYENGTNCVRNNSMVRF